LREGKKKEMGKKEMEGKRDGKEGEGKKKEMGKKDIKEK
jgi:hypothetical protein